MKRKSRTLFLTHAAVIAALYVVLTLVSFAFGLDKGVIQFRLSEALCVLPALTPAAIPGLVIGCLLSSLLTDANVVDILFGSLATLLGACGGYALRCFGRGLWRGFLTSLPTLLANLVAVPLILRFAYGVADGYWFLVMTVGLGEITTACLLGSILFCVLSRLPERIFRS